MLYPPFLIGGGMTVRCAGARLKEGGGAPLLERASALGADVVLMDADKVCGVDHLLSAAFHARRAFERGTASCNTLGMEVILYASGERQITKAKRKMGLGPGTERVALVLLDEEGDMDRLIKAMGLERDDALLACTRAKGEAFGISPRELETVGEGRLQDLVLEKVAFVDLLKR